MVPLLAPRLSPAMNWALLPSVCTHAVADHQIAGPYWCLAVQHGGRRFLAGRLETPGVRRKCPMLPTAKRLRRKSARPQRHTGMSISPWAKAIIAAGTLPVVVAGRPKRTWRTDNRLSLKINCRTSLSGPMADLTCRRRRRIFPFKFSVRKRLMAKPRHHSRKARESFCDTGLFLHGKEEPASKARKA